MPKHRIVYVASVEPSIELIEAQLSGLDYELDVQVCGSEGETIEAVKAPTS